MGCLYVGMLILDITEMVITRMEVVEGLAGWLRMILNCSEISSLAGGHKAAEVVKSYDEKPRYGILVMKREHNQAYS